MGILTLIEVILLLILDFSTPFHSTIKIENEINRTGLYKCTNSIPFIWMIIHSLYLGVILVMGIYFMYSTWGISSSVDDTRINVLMIFLCLVTLGVGDVIVAYSDGSELSVSWWGLATTIVWTLSMMCSIFVPKLVKSSKKSSSSNNTATDLSSVSSTSQSKKNTSSTL